MITRVAYYFFYLSYILVSATGLVYGWMRYFCEPDGEFDVVNHPWQPDLQHWHVLTAPLLVLMIGMFWLSHASSNWQGKVKEGRRTGWLLWTTALPMIMSGYLLQTAVSETWRDIWIGLHIATSLVWIVFGVAHIFIHWNVKRNSRRRLGKEG